MIGRVKDFKFYIVLVFVFFMVLLVNFLLLKREINILQNLNHFKVIPTTDSSEGGNSVIEVLPGKQTINFEYVKKSGIQYPYASVYIEKADQSLMDLSGHDLYVKARVSGANYMGFRLDVESEVVDKTNMRFSEVFYEKTLYSTDNIIDEKIHFSDLEIPFWWFQVQGIPDDKLNSKNFQQTRRIVFDHARGIPLDLKCKVSIIELKLIPHNKQLIIFNSIVGMILILVTVFYLIIRKPTKESVIIPAPYLASERNNLDELQKELEKGVVDYLSENYMVTKLTTKKVAEDLNLDARKVSEIIKNEFNLSFKQYLNLLRLSEAKSLLLNTNMRVNEVGYKVGYENPQHFLRVFKADLGITPSDYKQLHKSPS